MVGKLLSGVLLAAGAWAQAPAGRWDGIAEAGGLKVPFRIDFEGSGASFSGALVNGDARVASTSGSFEGGAIRLAFGRRFRVIGTLAAGQLTGTFESDRGRIPFQASAYCTCGVEGEPGPDVGGVWEVDDSWWRFAVKRSGDDTVVSGLEMGPISGRFDGIAFQLHYFDGIRAVLLEMEPKDGRLTLVWQVPGSAAKRYRAIKASQ